MRFHNRERELKILDNMYNSDQFDFVMVHGRRRIGKTYLLRYFVQDKRSAFYVANKQVASIQLPRLYASVSKNIIGDKHRYTFTSIEDFFDWLTDQIDQLDEKLIVVLDEFQYLVEILPSLPSIMKSWIENHWKNKNFMLIICGSEIGMMLDLVSISQPLYGMITSKLEINLFKFYEVMPMFPSLDIDTVAQVYAIFGGSPGYLVYYDVNKSLIENIFDTILSYGHKLFDEPSNLVQAELPNNSVYMDILYAIATGNNKISEIAGLIKKDARNIPSYTSRLEKLGLIAKLIPINEKSKSRNTRYHISDFFFKFWFKLIFPNNTAIEEEDYEFMKTMITSNLDNIMGATMEIIVIQLIKKMNSQGLLPLKADPKKIGNWWNSTGKSIELDCIALDRYKSPKKALFLEVKWGKRINQRQELSKLIDKVDNTYFESIPEKWYGIITRGFDSKQMVSGSIAFSDLINSVNRNVKLGFYKL